MRIEFWPREELYKTAALQGEGKPCFRGAFGRLEEDGLFVGVGTALHDDLYFTIVLVKAVDGTQAPTVLFRTCRQCQRINSAFFFAPPFRDRFKVAGVIGFRTRN